MAEATETTEAKKTRARTDREYIVQHHSDDGTSWVDLKIGDEITDTTSAKKWVRDMVADNKLSGGEYRVIAVTARFRATIEQKTRVNIE